MMKMGKETDPNYACFGMSWTMERAMVMILLEGGRIGFPEYVAAQINILNLYTREDGKPVEAKHVIATAETSDRFDYRNEVIFLIK